jgi:hypothetical protein
MSNITPTVASLPAPVQAIVASLNAPGAFTPMTWRTTKSPAAAHRGRVLTKITHALVRTGVEYAAISSVAMRLAAEGREAGDLPWGEWAVYPLIVRNGDEYYLRVAPVPGHTMRSEYFIDGAPVAREEWYAMQPPSARKEGAPEVLTIKVSNIL